MDAAPATSSSARKLTDLLLRGGAPISGLPEIGTSIAQVGYSRLAVRRLEGWPLARSRLWPSFETRARARSSGRGLLTSRYDSNLGDVHAGPRCKPRQDRSDVRPARRRNDDRSLDRSAAAIPGKNHRASP